MTQAEPPARSRPSDDFVIPTGAFVYQDSLALFWPPVAEPIYRYVIGDSAYLESYTKGFSTLPTPAQVRASVGNCYVCRLLLHAVLEGFRVSARALFNVEIKPCWTSVSSNKPRHYCESQRHRSTRTLWHYCLHEHNDHIMYVCFLNVNVFVPFGAGAVSVAVTLGASGHVGAFR